MKGYITQKCDTLRDFGITDRQKLKAYLKAKTADITDPEKKEIRIDRLCRDIIRNFLDNRDMTFVLLSDE